MTGDFIRSLTVLSILLLCLQAKAQSVSDFLRQAGVREASQDAAGALEIVEAGLAVHPNSAALEDKAGFLLAVMRRYPEAVERFESALRHSPGLAAAHYHLGIALWLQERRPEALAALQKAVTLGPETADYRFRLGSALNDLGRASEAITHLRRAVSIRRPFVSTCPLPAWPMRCR